MVSLRSWIVSGHSNLSVANLEVPSIPISPCMFIFLHFVESIVLMQILSVGKRGWHFSRSCKMNRISPKFLNPAVTLPFAALSIVYVMICVIMLELTLGHQQKLIQYSNLLVRKSVESGFASGCVEHTSRQMACYSLSDGFSRMNSPMFFLQWMVWNDNCLETLL